MVRRCCSWRRDEQGGLGARIRIEDDTTAAVGERVDQRLDEWPIVVGHDHQDRWFLHEHAQPYLPPPRRPVKFALSV